jgi:NADPH-dependent 2,4-dienoyl-CoA reductase/sulfur reductase-like enzyme
MSTVKMAATVGTFAWKRSRALMHLVAIGGSDAGISAALRAREVDPRAKVTVVVADAYPNFSICGIPYLVSGDVARWENLAHRDHQTLKDLGLNLLLDTTVTRIDAAAHQLTLADLAGQEGSLSYDRLVIGTGASSVRPPIGGIDTLGPADGVHLLHTMDDTFALIKSIEERPATSALIVGAGYIGIEMAEALLARGLRVTHLEQLPEVLPTVDPELGVFVRGELSRHGADVHVGTTVESIGVSDQPERGRLRVTARTAGGAPLARSADVVLVVTGVRPNSELAAAAGVRLGVKSAINVDSQMRTNLPDVFAAGDCVVTHHRLGGVTYLPLGTTAHKQGRVAGENALGGTRDFAGSLGTQVVKVFDLVVARTGLRDHEAAAAGLDPLTVATEPDDHKAYYPGAHPIQVRCTGDRRTRRLLGVQMFGHQTSEIAKRIDTAATALFHGMTVDAMSDLDLSYTPPLGSPWDAIQTAAQAWVRARDATPA